MHMFDLLKRCKDRQHTEVRLGIKEDVLLKSMKKYFQELAKTRSTLKSELKTRNDNRRRLAVLERKNKKLTMLLEKQEQHAKTLDELESKAADLRITLEEEQFRKCFKKECTNVFINPRALPTAAQGMLVSLSEGNSVWRPFSMPIKNLNMNEIPLEFWTRKQDQDKHRQQWDYLILGGISLN